VQGAQVNNKALATRKKGNIRKAHSEAVLYARYSPRPKAKDCQSCKSQLAMLEEYCKLKSLTVIGTYQDKAFTARNMMRPRLQEAMDAACVRSCLLVVYDFSRFARNCKDALFALERLNDHGAGLVSLREDINTSTSYGRLIFTILMAVAEAEAIARSEQSKEHTLMRQAMGRRVSHIPPYGWRPDKTRPKRDEWGRLITKPDGTAVYPFMERDSKEQEVLKKIMYWRNSGCTYGWIAKELEMLGIETKTGRGHWNDTIVRRIYLREVQTRAIYRDQGIKEY
jgi:DNA invertase Pin-like site-specific DNA recombinase